MSGGSREKMSLAAEIEATVARVDAMLDRLLPRHGRLAEAMRYAALAPGKRLRPFLTRSQADGQSET